MCELITLEGYFSKIQVDGITVARVNARTDGLCECRSDGVSCIVSPELAAQWLTAIAMQLIVVR